MQGLRTVIYKVPDLKQATAWYSKAFETTPYFEEPFYVGFSIEGYELGLLPEEGSDDTLKASNILAYWGVRSMEIEFARLLALGATVHESPTDVGEGIVTASVFDPYGNVIGLIFNPHFKVDD